MLGREQLTWFEENLKQSKANWKVIGNQVIFAEINLSSVWPKMPRNLDSWDGYPAEKKAIEDFIVKNKIKDIVFTTGDTHGSWAIEVPDGIKKNYSAYAVEFGTTSISSANGDEYKNIDTVRRAEVSVMKNNPHVKYVNDRDHGYMLLTLYPDKAKVDWFYTKTLRQPETEETLGKSFVVERGTSRLK